MPETNRILPFNKLKEISDDCRRQKKVIVVTNGVFDILHTGHLELLNKAKTLGDVLIVGINSDSSVKKLKGPNRPLVSEDERAEILTNLRAVDYVSIFDQDTAVELLDAIQPDIYVKGGDYNPNNLPEAKSFKGKIEFIKLVQGKSSTGLIDKIKIL